MKSGLQHKSSALDSTQKKNNGTARKVTLLCCALFFLAQLFSLISSLQQKDTRTFYLQTATPESLTLTEKSADVSNVSASFTPFFFKPVPINFCDKSLLLSVVGIGPMLADNIIHTRETHGFYKNKHDLLLVAGIGESRMNNLAESFSFATTR